MGGAGRDEERAPVITATGGRPMTTATAQVQPNVRTMANKVPLITAIFWVIKILSTTVGETTSDYLSVNAGLGVGVTDSITFALLAAALVVQFRTRSYTPCIYWLTV